MKPTATLTAVLSLALLHYTVAANAWAGGTQDAPRRGSGLSADEERAFAEREGGSPRSATFIGGQAAEEDTTEDFDWGLFWGIMGGVLVFVLLIALIASSAQTSGGGGPPPVRVNYTCSACGGSFDHPGTCHTCGMSLVRKGSQ